MQTGDSPETVKCPWCENPFDVIPNSSASGFKCPHCAIESSLGSLRNPNLNPNALALAEFTSLAATENVYRSTAAYVFIDKTGVENVASGTVVEFGDLRLLATVAHSVPKNLDSIELVKRSKLIHPSRINCVTRRVAHTSLDLALFELDPNSLAQANLEAVGVDRILDAGVGNTSRKSRLCGYPSAHIVENHLVRGVRAMFALCYGCETIEASRWKNVVKNPDSLKSDLHVVVEYNPDVVDSTSVTLPVPSGLPRPYGMSGGGLWQRDSLAKDDEIWSADAYCLFAIQAAIFVDKPFLKATQIIHWLKLVADNYPKLRGDLESRFPRLASV